MISFITNMQQASQVNAETITPRDLINQWITDRGLGGTADSFLENFSVSNVTSGASVVPADLDTPLRDGQTLSVYTKAVATGGVKAAC